MTTHDYQFTELNPQQLNVLDVLAERLSDRDMQDAIREIIRSHRGPYEYSDHPNYLISRSEVPNGFWNALGELKCMGLSSGPLNIYGADDSHIEAQRVDPLVLKEILSALIVLLSKLLGLSDDEEEKPVLGSRYSELDCEGPGL